MSETTPFADFHPILHLAPKPEAAPNIAMLGTRAEFIDTTATGIAGSGYNVLAYNCGGATPEEVTELAYHLSAIGEYRAVILASLPHKLGAAALEAFGMHGVPVVRLDFEQGDPSTDTSQLASLRIPAPPSAIQASLAKVLDPDTRLRNL